MRLPLFIAVLLTSTLPLAQGADDYKPSLMPHLNWGYPKG